MIAVGTAAWMYWQECFKPARSQSERALGYFVLKRGESSMASPQTSALDPEASFQVRRTFNASRERLFEAWTQREHLNQWMGRTKPASSTEYLELDLRPGGRYRARIATPEGHVYFVFGVYREVRPPQKLSFTWEWEKFNPAGEVFEKLADSLVTVEFLDRGGETEVVLTHTGLANTALRDRHQLGWNACFDALAGFL
jgi:uncharacterized protein YndB with AHSA1/START domain